MEQLHFWAGISGLMLAIILINHAREEFDVTAKWKLMGGAGIGLVAFGSWLLERV